MGRRARGLIFTGRQALLGDFEDTDAEAAEKASQDGHRVDMAGLCTPNCTVPESRREEIAQ